MTSESHTRTRSTPFLPPRWVITTAWRAHRVLYRVSGGRLGLRSDSEGREGLAQLTTVGRRSGQQRSVMIAYYRHGEDYVTMAMNGWDAAEPAWWLNLQAQPQATLTLSDQTVEITGRAATESEHDELWDRWRQLDSAVDKFSARRTSGTTVVVLAPTTS